MAATLTEWCSRRLLPPDAPEVRQADADAEALRSDLLNQTLTKAGADWLEQRHQLGQEIFPRGGKGGNISKRVGDLTELLRACLVALRVPEEQAAAYRPRPPPFWTERDTKARMEKLLPALLDGSPLAQFLPRIGAEEPRRALRCRVAVSQTLIAGLELARNGALALDHEESWSRIRVQHPKGHVVGAGEELSGFRVTLNRHTPSAGRTICQRRCTCGQRPRPSSRRTRRCASFAYRPERRNRRCHQCG